MTTNGIRLASLAQGLADAGLRRVNVSLDSLDREKFRKITRWGDLDQVLAGLDAARAAGLTPIKLNAVVVRGFNEDDVVELARLTTTRDWTVRFIEMMPFGSVAGFQTSAYVPTAETMAKIEAAIGPLVPLDVSGYDPARTYRFDGAPGTLGFISSVSQPFCRAVRSAAADRGGPTAPVPAARRRIRSPDAAPVRRHVREDSRAVPRRRV